MCCSRSRPIVPRKSWRSFFGDPLSFGEEKKGIAVKLMQDIILGRGRQRPHHPLCELDQPLSW